MMAIRRLVRSGVLGASGFTAIMAGTAQGADDPYSNLPQTMNITGAMRDFRDQQTAAGHPDFNIFPAQWDPKLGIHVT